jgi:transposase
MAKFTIKEFRKQYPNEETCLDKIFTLRYGKLEACPKCQCKASFRRITTRRCYQCTECYEQFYPTAGTVFEKTRTPLEDWFYIIHLFVATRNGVSAKEIERQLGVTYKTAWRMGHQIRTLIGGCSTEQLNGLVEADETYIGGKNKNRHANKKIPNSQGRSTKGKAIVFGMVERGGEVRTKVLQEVTTETLKGALLESVKEGANVYTDDAHQYRGIADSFVHNHVNHSKSEYVRGDVHTNTVEGFFSQLKRTIGGTHISVSKKYLQNYANECAFRYSNRNLGGEMFDKIIQNMPIVQEIATA